MANTPDEKPKHQWQLIKEGWYEKAVGSMNLTTRKLDIVIGVCIALLIISFLFVYQDRGYTITFDTLGGTPVESQKLMYGDSVVVEEPPTREGYEFAGWYKDILCQEPWNLETDTVEGSMTLYAAWEEKTQ